MLSQNLTIWNWLRMRPPSLEEFQWELFDSLAEQLVMGGDPASSSDIHPVTFKSSDLESQVWCLIGTDAREGNGTPLQYSCLENPMDGGAWWAAVLGVAKSQRRLSDFTFTFHFHASEKEWQPTPVFLPGESQERGSLVGCRLWGRTESDTTEAT